MADNRFAISTGDVLQNLKETASNYSTKKKRQKETEQTRTIMKKHEEISDRNFVECTI